MKWKILILVLFFFLPPSLALAYQLDGTLSNYNEDNGSYSVSLENEDGHHYTGQADERPDGTLVLTVQDDKGETYSGIAKENQEGIYDLNLVNKVTGVRVNGELDEE